MVRRTTRPMNSASETMFLSKCAREEALKLIEQQELSTVPVDLRRLFVSLNVERVQFDADLGCSGIVYQGRQGWIIALNAKDPKTRQRFSCAHELAHLVLNKVANDVAVTERSHLGSLVADREIERLCDELASLFVLPPAVVSRWDQEPVSVARLINLAIAARISPDAAAARAIPASSQPVTFVKWRLATRPGSSIRTWRAWWTVRSGISNIYFPPNKSAPDRLRDAFSQALEGKFAFELAQGARKHPVEIEFARRGEGERASILSVLRPADT